MSTSNLILGYAVTPIHVGAGRTPGIVDLPFQRDSIGYPIVYGSSFKGVLKSFLINRNKADIAKCFFGAEPDEDSKTISKYIITDMLPVIYPVASIEEGYLYITTEYLLSRAEDIVSSVSPSFNLYNEDEQKQNNQINLLTGSAVPSRTIKPNQQINDLGSLIRSKGKVYVFGSDIGLQFVESALIRVARNVLDKSSKTSKNLWYEEYVPPGTVFVGGIIDTPRPNSFCKELSTNFQNEFNNQAIFLGGKESIGKGLIKLLVI